MALIKQLCEAALLVTKPFMGEIATNVKHELRVSATTPMRLAR